MLDSGVTDQLGKKMAQRGPHCQPPQSRQMRGDLIQQVGPQAVCDS